MVSNEQTTAGEFVRLAKWLADDFQFPQALLAFRRAMQLDKFNMEAHYLCGVMALRMDRLDEAIEALERACYLDKGLVMGHFLFGHIYQEKSKQAMARHHYQQVLDALGSGEVDEPVRFAEDMTVQILRELCAAGQEAISVAG